MIGIGVNIVPFINKVARTVADYVVRITGDAGVSESTECANTTLSQLDSKNLFNSASLIISPSGYKGGKLYSEIPTNGNGDLTWTRGGDAFRTNASGVIQRVPWNLLQYSEAFDNVAWAKQDSSITANATIAPNGTLTADKLVENTSTSAHSVWQGNNLPNQIYTYSFYAKASERVWVYTRGDIGLNYFNVSTGVVGTTSAGATSTIQNVGNGWYRCIVTKTFQPQFNTQIAISTADNVNSYTGDGTSGLFIWGAQLVEGTTAQTYLPTTDRLNFPRLSYMYGSCPALLAEPQRTNSLRNSTMVGASTSPSTLPTNWTSFTTYGLTVAIAGVGTENGVNYIDISYTGTATTSDAVRIGFEQSLQISASNGQSWSLSTYAKIISQSAPPSSYDLRMTERALVGGGVVTLGTQSITPTSTLTRFTYTRTLSGGATVGYVAPEFSVPVINGTSYNFTIRIAQPQMELGAYATTPILTTTASATRVADSFSRNNIYTNGLITSSGGTWFVSLVNNVAYTRDNTSRTGITDDTTNFTNALFLLSSPSSRLSVNKLVGGAFTSLYNTNADITKLAIKWNGTTADIFANGTKVISATSFTPTNMQFLHSQGVGSPMFIQQMALFPTPLSDTDCTTLTT